jgi:hypothetical protein
MVQWFDGNFEHEPIGSMSLTLVPTTLPVVVPLAIC